MKIIIFLVAVFISVQSFAQDETSKWREIPSITDWIDEINNWPDSAYSVSNIKVYIDFEKDTLFYEPQWTQEDEQILIAGTIRKPINVKDFHFEGIFKDSTISIKNIRFKEEVRFLNYKNRMIPIKNAIFDKTTFFGGSDDFVYYNLINCEFKGNLGFYDLDVPSKVYLDEPKIEGRLFFVRSTGFPQLEITNGKIDTIDIENVQFSSLEITNSTIGEISARNSQVTSVAHITENQIGSMNVTGAQFPETNTYLPFDQIKRRLYYSQPRSLFDPSPEKYFASDSFNFENKIAYDLLVGSYKVLQDRYQKFGDQDSYNACYVEMKNFETRRLAYLFDQNPSFKSFFTWKINQFLKVFSAYGTEPARAIIFSIYVILVFALIYLFFPNSWDAHGKNRIVDRYSFFFKYLQRNAGMHEVYLEEKKNELLGYDEFKSLITQSEKSVPRFFSATALPLYQWAISGTRLSAKILSKVDILKGTWEDLPAGQKAWKSFLLVGGFLIALVYDLLIKVLNALMLSINTFTTLGFGEIPIKGLPRYLAIIQGFIGWFMLTIFSVSLISQLLN
ncbi:potassium channel family protein [Algoriphagus limi]|uniref:Potassium channel family protein n=1 Tax=Algoriphagus limi TaxID=2975273 RepID=A0ABT2G7U6_9BACT|nr:potassium channel family protein [Algoriphagus limi]MCS5491334.1 potassium channel family protein [Algoriphagus limi]